MKRFSALLAGFLFAVALITAPVGCTTGTNNTTAKVEAGVIPSVNVAMSLWKTRVDAGKATQAQVDQVRAVYSTYYNSQLVLKAALEKSIVSKVPGDIAATEAANKAAQDAQVAIINLIAQLSK